MSAGLNLRREASHYLSIFPSPVISIVRIVHRMASLSHFLASPSTLVPSGNSSSGYSTTSSLFAGELLSCSSTDITPPMSPTDEELNPIKLVSLDLVDSPALASPPKLKLTRKTNENEQVSYASGESTPNTPVSRVKSTFFPISLEAEDAGYQSGY